ncbi:hypothetical protein NDU88_006941 [Pleurodeles waltl]|uniref:Uncharacterized protein n=1 Tax=Pleurodeles waltl TaxID=8319 RepID=A0AAV7LQL5_PLEWA|nr:hypothetical protein NDU88_006941 [Pleurodeles waltl]
MLERARDNRSRSPRPSPTWQLLPRTEAWRGGARTSGILSGGHPCPVLFRAVLRTGFGGPVIGPPTGERRIGRGLAEGLRRPAGQLQERASVYRGGWLGPTQDCAPRLYF